MNQKIKEHVVKYNKSKGWGEDEESVIETIIDSKEVFSKTIDSRRHWDETFNVVEVDGMLIGYDGARTTGDMSAEEKGWEFDSDTICEVKKETETETKTVYKEVR
jgi:hypothetical protein